MPDVILRTEDLTKRYGARAAVDQVSLTLRAGDIYGFVGRNGAGKTTFIRMVTGLAAPDAGRIEIYGETTARGLARARRQTGCMVETPSFYGYMTAYDNLLVSCRLTGADPRTRIPAVLERMGLQAEARRRVKHLSLGQRQRLGLARALLNRPALLLLDEPVNGLDPVGVARFREDIRRLAHEEGAAILISSHLLGELAMLANRYGIIHEGRLVEELSGEDLARLNHEVVVMRTSDAAGAQEALLTDPALAPAGVQITPDGELHISGAGDRTGALCRRVVEAGIDVLALGTRAFTLEDHFIQQTGGDGDA